MLSWGLLHIDMPVLANQQGLAYIISVDAGLSRGPARSKGWQRRMVSVSELRAVSMTWLFTIIQLYYLYILILSKSKHRRSLSDIMAKMLDYCLCSIGPLYPGSLQCWVLSKVASSTIIWFFGMTWPGIEPRSFGPLVNTQLRPMVMLIICV